jgi:hypothetical protein
MAAEESNSEHPERSRAKANQEADWPAWAAEQNL